tara:strand:- start:1 stop:480 length:480 start_codon:yes stop_codon:yes gene_type:complete
MNKISIDLTTDQLNSITKQARDAGGADYRFDINLLEGKLSESNIAEILETIEVKKDYQAWRTGNIAVEYECNGKPSGVSTTKAKYVAYILVDQDQTDKIMFFIKTGVLLQMCRQYLGVQGRDITGGDNYASKLILLPIEELVNKDILFNNQLSINTDEE